MFTLGIVGIILLVIEGFIPGFGIFGLAGLALIVYNVFTVYGLYAGIMAAVAALVLLIWFLARLSKKGEASALFRLLGLSSSIDSKAGYGTGAEEKIPLGTRGKTVSALRPSGYIVIGLERYDAVAEEGTFIENNREVEVIRISGSNVIVREVCHE